ncbi:hypothetical protein NDU88_000650 [Pleurodeles waltl]|uniref:Uncharacterized protein n=1 Tax=Pleurodeles waltl TaxID=8319 RepID=A0AAV7MIA1_PLEWA|nr:hypothetical protein NDU88_000650 [Pleurodeles waltl]
MCRTTYLMVPRKDLHKPGKGSTAAQEQGALMGPWCFEGLHEPALGPGGWVFDYLPSLSDGPFLRACHPGEQARNAKLTSLNMTR